MWNEKLRIMFFSKGTALKQLSLTSKEFYIYSTLTFLFLVVFIAIGLQGITHLFHNYRISALEKEKKQLQKDLLVYKEKIAWLNERLTEVEKMGDELRNVAGLPSVDEDTRQLGVGGSFYSNPFPEPVYLDEVGRIATEAKMDLEKIERAIQFEKLSLNEVHVRINEFDQKAHHFPSIRPILGAPVIPNFGLRVDPFLDKIATHEGVDIPMPVGTKVLATADGVVKVANMLYVPSRSYGMEVVIDHGYGYETRYAHLSKIYVRVGQKDKRWDPIGEVGQTGRATGPHLHYEVRFSGKPQNPVYFMFN